MLKKIIWCTLALLLAGIVLFGCASSSTTGKGGMTGTGGTTTSGGTSGTGTAAPTTTGTGSPSVPGTTDNQPRPTDQQPKMDDLTITDAVRAKLQQEGITDIQVQVKEGDVTLSGKVSDPATADRIVQLVRTVENVKDVHSDLQISQ